MRSVAAEAGISVPGVYHHYPNKQSLLVAVFQVAAAELTAHIRGALADATNASTRLVNLSEATVLFAAHRRDLTAITITDRHLLGGAAATAAADEFNRLVAAFAQHRRGELGARRARHGEPPPRCASAFTGGSTATPPTQRGRRSSTPTT